MEIRACDQDGVKFAANTATARLASREENRVRSARRAAPPSSVGASGGLIHQVPAEVSGRGHGGDPHERRQRVENALNA